MAHSAFGAEYARFAPFAKPETETASPTYREAFSLGGIVSATETPNLTTGSLYSNNKETLRKDAVSSYTVALTTDGLGNQDAATLYGAEFDVASGEIRRGTDDSPPFGGFAYIRNIATEDDEYYKGYFYPKVKAAPAADGANTRGQNLTYSTTSINLTAFAPKHKGTKVRIESRNYGTLQEVMAWINAKFNTAVYHAVKISTNGAGAGESVSPIGFNYVADTDSIAITITGTATALYDNGTDNVAAVVDGVYTLTNVTADHDIVVVF